MFPQLNSLQYYELERELKKMERLGSVIFPMKGNELFDSGKNVLKSRIKEAKQLLKEHKTRDD